MLLQSQLFFGSAQPPVEAGASLGLKHLPEEEKMVLVLKGLPDVPEHMKTIKIVLPSELSAGLQLPQRCSHGFFVIGDDDSRATLHCLEKGSEDPDIDRLIFMGCEDQPQRNQSSRAAAPQKAAQLPASSLRSLSFDQVEREVEVDYLAMGLKVSAHLLRKGQEKLHLAVGLIDKDFVAPLFQTSDQFRD